MTNLFLCWLLCLVVSAGAIQSPFTLVVNRFSKGTPPKALKRNSERFRPADLTTIIVANLFDALIFQTLSNDGLLGPLSQYMVKYLERDIDKETAFLATHNTPTTHRALNAVLSYFGSTRVPSGSGDDEATMREVERDIRNLKLRRRLWVNCNVMTEIPLVFLILLCRPSFQILGIRLLQGDTLRTISIWQRLASVLLGCFQFSRIRAGHESAGIYCVMSLCTFLLGGWRRPRRGLAEMLLGICPMVAKAWVPLMPPPP
jgi:hypothetical protein